MSISLLYLLTAVSYVARLVRRTVFVIFKILVHYFSVFLHVIIHQCTDFEHTWHNNVFLTACNIDVQCNKYKNH